MPPRARTPRARHADSAHHNPVPTGRTTTHSGRLLPGGLSRPPAPREGAPPPASARRSTARGAAQRAPHPAPMGRTTTHSGRLFFRGPFPAARSKRGSTAARISEAQHGPGGCPARTAPRADGAHHNPFRPPASRGPFRAARRAPQPRADGAHHNPFRPPAPREGAPPPSSARRSTARGGLPSAHRTPAPTGRTTTHSGRLLPGGLSRLPAPREGAPPPASARRSTARGAARRAPQPRADGAHHNPFRPPASRGPFPAARSKRGSTAALISEAQHGPGGCPARTAPRADGARQGRHR